VRSDMNEWTEIRRKVLVEGASKRSIRRDYGIGSEALKKILANAEPPGYRQNAVRPKPRLGQFLGVIEEILEADKTAPVKQRHTARRIYERLRDEYGYTGCSSQVRTAVPGHGCARKRSSSRSATHRAAPSSTSARPPS
jgi:transposase